jgi:hypothetical protein
VRRFERAIAKATRVRSATVQSDLPRMILLSMGRITSNRKSVVQSHHEHRANVIIEWSASVRLGVLPQRHAVDRKGDPLCVHILPQMSSFLTLQGVTDSRFDLSICSLYSPSWVPNTNQVDGAEKKGR